jgi:hypothetical protein
MNEAACSVPARGLEVDGLTAHATAAQQLAEPWQR